MSTTTITVTKGSSRDVHKRWNVDVNGTLVAGPLKVADANRMAERLAGALGPGTTYHVVTDTTGYGTYETTTI